MMLLSTYLTCPKKRKSSSLYQVHPQLIFLHESFYFKCNLMFEKFGIKEAKMPFYSYKITKKVYKWLLSIVKFNKIAPTQTNQVYKMHY